MDRIDDDPLNTILHNKHPRKHLRYFNRDGPPVFSAYNTMNGRIRTSDANFAVPSKNSRQSLAKNTGKFGGKRLHSSSLRGPVARGIVLDQYCGQTIDVVSNSCRIQIVPNVLFAKCNVVA